MYKNLNKSVISARVSCCVDCVCAAKNKLQVVTTENQPMGSLFIMISTNRRTDK